MRSSDGSISDTGEFEVQWKPRPGQSDMHSKQCFKRVYLLGLDGWRRKQVRSCDVAAVSSSKDQEMELDVQEVCWDVRKDKRTCRTQQGKPWDCGADLTPVKGKRGGRRVG